MKEMSEGKRGDRGRAGMAKQGNKGAGGRPIVRKGGWGQESDRGEMIHQRRIRGGRDIVEEGEGDRYM